MSWSTNELECEKTEQIDEKQVSICRDPHGRRYFIIADGAECIIVSGDEAARIAAILKGNP